MDFGQCYVQGGAQGEMKRGGMKKAWPSNIRELELQVSLQYSSAICILVLRTLLHSRFAQFQNVSELWFALRIWPDCLIVGSV